MEDFGDAVTTMKRNSAVSLKDKNGNIVQIQRETEKIVEKTVNIKITEETEKIVEKVEKIQIGGRKIDISGWNDFMKGRQHHLYRHYTANKLFIQGCCFAHVSFNHDSFDFEFANINF